MLRSNLNQQNAYELICIEELVPSDHLMLMLMSYLYDRRKQYTY
jgi:hypothetical protein